uniref:Nudix hydrolase domain-containing protein n=1 Tax=Lotharella globosa TaxID=91324 RepID=A0A7S3YHV5_9EUKA
MCSDCIPGEFAFPGGAKEPSDVDMEETAKRELQEELLGIQIPPDDFHVRLFDVIKVQGFRRKYQVHIFVAFDKINKWLELLEVQHLNDNLYRRMEEFEDMLSTGEFWRLNMQHKMYVSPEVHHFEWMPLRTAVIMASSPHIQYVNDFQYQEFQKYGVQSREPVGEQMIEVLQVLLKELEPEHDVVI